MKRLHWLGWGAAIFLLGYLVGTQGPTGPELEVQASTPAVQQAQAAIPVADGKLRIIAFGAHPDDCELKVGGTAARWAALGHHVKLVSVTNGDIGHWQMAGGPLAQRRLAETQQADKILGVTCEVLDIHDGELEPNLETRRKIVRLIREWQADLVLSHRPNDYHPDHRYTGVVVQDAAYMVTVPYFSPDVPHLTKNPVFMTYADRFERPNPTRADMVVELDDVFEQKLDALAALHSQFFEGGANGGPELIPKDEAGFEMRRKQVRDGFRRRDASVADRYREQLRKLYGADRGDKVRYAEAFEICEYGNQPDAAQLRRLFPFFGAEGT